MFTPPPTASPPSISPRSSPTSSGRSANVDSSVTSSSSSVSSTRAPFFFFLLAFLLTVWLRTRHSSSSSSSARWLARAGLCRVSSTAAFFAAFRRRIFSSCSSLSLRAFSLPVPLHPMPNPATWTLLWDPVPFFPPLLAACATAGSSSKSSSEETSPRLPFRVFFLRSTACAACVAASSAVASACSLRICFVMRFTCSSVFGLLLPFAMVAQVVTRSSSARPPPTREWRKSGVRRRFLADTADLGPAASETSEEPSRPFANLGAITPI